jgi:hypothetical protein
VETSLLGGLLQTPSAIKVNTPPDDGVEDEDEGFPELWYSGKPCQKN